MTGWNLSKIILYSHDHQTRVLPFSIGAVNIITGESGTGKSALIQVIDYCLGSRKCEIADFVKSRCAWVATVWSRDTEECFIARKVPGTGEVTTRRFHLITGSNLQIPASEELPKDGGETGALSRFSRLMGINEASSETFGAETRDAFSVSVRHTLPFLLQSDEVIMNPRTLFWGGNDQHRQAIIDTLPYFLGAVDENSTALYQRLAELRKEQRRLERKAKSIDATEANRSVLVSELLAEARELGMAPNIHDEGQESLTGVVETLAKWDVRTDPPTEGGSELVQLQDRERRLTAEYFSIDREIKEAEGLSQEMGRFGETVAAQSNRLQAVNLIKRHDPISRCPLCEGNLGEITEPLENLHRGLLSLSADLSEISRERPHILDLVGELKEKRSKIQSDLRSTRAQIKAIVLKDQELSNQRSLDSLRNQVVGKAKQLLRVLEEKVSPDESNRLKEICSEMEGLEGILDPDFLRERLEALANRVGQIANTLLEKLPFDDNYRNATASFNPRTLSASLMTGDGRLINMPGIGSDENYLSLHVAFMLSMHRLFRESHRPVPSLLVFDQVSRPYFPPDTNSSTVDLDKERGRLDERKKVRDIFDLLFNVVQEEKSLQVIVLEHALFPSDERFMSAIVEQWPKGTGLIPSTWRSVA